MYGLTMKPAAKARTITTIVSISPNVSAFLHSSPGYNFVVSNISTSPIFVRRALKQFVGFNEHF
jgi:hypothetical protein